MNIHGVSIIICCYNSAELLSSTLEYIASQKVDERIPWEVLIVNNASTDNTKEVAAAEWKKYECEAPFTIVDQPIPGLIAARRKGVEQARYEYLLFCDDDNWLQNDYVQYAYNIMESRENVGALGGRSEAVFETERPDWFGHHKMAYAVGRQSEHSGDITDKEGKIFGAGMILRASALEKLHQADFQSQLTGRKGGALSSAEDMEICYALRMAGYNIWYDERLYFQHYITRGRLKWEYLVKLQEAFGRSAIITNAYLHVLNNSHPQQKRETHNFLWIKKMFRICKHLIALSFKGGTWSTSAEPASDNQKKNVLIASYFKGQLIEIVNVRSDYSDLFERLYELQDRLLPNKSEKLNPA